MRIIGWIREGDRAACDGLVIEGDQRCTSNGRPYSFEGARMICAKKCVIAEGFPRRTLTNGRHAVIHGMKTSGGCPLLSTLNERDGIRNERAEVVPETFFLNADGQWTGAAPHEDPHDEQVKLPAQLAEGLQYLIKTNDGRTFSGKVGPDGLLPRIDTFGEDEYQVLWGDEALAKINESQGNGR